MIYLIHFDVPYKRVSHYIGFTSKKTVKQRMNYHRKGLGSRLMKAVTEAGINWQVVRTWPGGTRTEERQMKNQKNHKRLCPVCKAKPIADLAPVYTPVAFTFSNLV